MNEAADIDTEARRIDAIYRAKARAELAAAESLIVGKAVRGQGDVLAEVMLVKGEPGPHDLKSGRALSGPDGLAIGKALDALELPKARYAFCTRTGEGSEAEHRARLRALVEAVDPTTIVLLDPGAACDLAAAYEVGQPAAGVVARIAGRRVLAVDDFEASLGDEKRKRRVWKQLRALGGSK